MTLVPAAPRIVRNDRTGIDWNTCGQAAIATVLASMRRGPFTPGGIGDGDAIDWVRRDHPGDVPLGLGTSAPRIAAALRDYGLTVERLHSGWFGRDIATVLARVVAHTRAGYPVPVCVDQGLLGGAAACTAHWAIALGFDERGVRLGNMRDATPVPLARFLPAWQCRFLPYGHNHAAVLASP